MNKRVVVSRDVIFEEDKQWDWDVSYEKQIVFDLVWDETNRGETSEREGESNNDHRRETGDDGVKVCEEEGEGDDVCVEEERGCRSDVEGNVENGGNERDGATDEVGRNAGHPTVCVMTAGRVGENADLTARGQPGGSVDGVAEDVDPTAGTRPGVFLDDSPITVNPIIRILLNGVREGDLLTCGRRERGPPVWMQDYVTGENLSEDETDMALIMSYDPIHFEDAVKVNH